MTDVQTQSALLEPLTFNNRFLRELPADPDSENDTFHFPLLLRGSFLCQFLLAGEVTFPDIGIA